MKTAMILAAGRGERMRPLTDSVPKPLLQVHQKTLIQYHLENLKRAGVERVVINHSWLGEQIVDKIGSGEELGLEILYSHEPTALETAGGIIQALPLLCPNEQTQSFWVVNGDVFTDFDFALLPVDLGEQLAHLVMVDNPSHNPTGDFSLQGGLLGNNAEGKLTFSGIAAYHKSFFSDMQAEVRPLAPLFFECIEQMRLGGQKHSGFWSDVGTPERLQLLNDNKELV